MFKKQPSFLDTYRLTNWLKAKKKGIRAKIMTTKATKNVCKMK